VTSLTLAARLRAIGREGVEQFEDRAIAAMLVDKPVQRLTTEPPALRAFDRRTASLPSKAANVVPVGPALRSLRRRDLMRPWGKVGDVAGQRRPRRQGN